MAAQELSAGGRETVRVLTSRGWRRPGRPRGGRRRRARRAALAAALLACSGCSYLDLLDDHPFSEAVFYGSGAVVGAPLTVALAPVTLPLASVIEDDEGLLALLGPGLALGGLVGGIVSSPFLLCELTLDALSQAAAGRGHDCARPIAEDAVSRCPYCGVEDGACDWGETCAEEQVDDALDASLEQAWPPAALGPPALLNQGPLDLVEDARHQPGDPAGVQEDEGQERDR